MANRTMGRDGTGAGLARGALAAGLLLGAAGCVGAPVYKDKQPYVFTLAFDAQGCPVAARADLRNCPDKREDCVRVRGGEEVRFEASPPADAAGKPHEFVLHFDPFGRTEIASDRGVLTVAAERHEKPEKPYTFTVTSRAAGCPKPLDPQIILD